MRPIFRLLLWTTVLSSAAAIMFKYSVFTSVFFLALLFIAQFISNCNNINFVVKCLVYITFIETFLFFTLMNALPSSIPSAWISSTYYLSLFILDFAIFYLVKNRQSIQLKTCNDDYQLKKVILQKSIVDAPIMGIFILFCLIDALLLTENIIRNLEHFGVAEEAAKKYWDWMFFYDYSQPLKHFLLSLTVMILFAGIYITRSRAARGEKPLSYDDCSTSN